MEKLPILYSFRRCPYAMRARLALFISNTKCELREVLLKAKPEQLIKISKKGTVPVLQLAPKKIIDGIKISLKKKGNNIMNTVNHRQNAKEIGGTDSTPPLATIVFVAIKIG